LLNEGVHVAALTTNRNSSYGCAQVTPMLILDDSKVEEARDGRGELVGASRLEVDFSAL